MTRRVLFERRVLELDAAGRVSQQQASTAHVATADEGRRKTEPFTETLNEHVHVLPRRDAAEQHDTAVRREAGGERVQVAIERRAIPSVVRCNIDCREFANDIRAHDRVWRLKPSRRRDDERAVARLRKRTRVRDLAPEVQSAAERERISQRQGPCLQTGRDVDRRARPQHALRATSAAVRG